MIWRKIPAIFGTKIGYSEFRPSEFRDLIKVNMNTPLRVSKGYGAQVKYAVLMPLFFFIFCFVYDPFGFQKYYSVGGKSFTFHLVMLCCIMMGVYALTRLIFSALYKHIQFLWWHYVVWCFGEVLIISFFFALYTTLFYVNDGGMPYFAALTYCFKLTFLILVYPYLTAILLRIISNKTHDAENVQDFPADTLFKFYDEHKRLKLSISPSALVYVSAEANYVNIHYLENDKVKTYQLRNSMKSIDAGAESHGLVRCHRSYYVNPRMIKVLSRDKDGIIYTEFIHEGIGRIPVSKQYYDNLAKLL